MSETIAEVEGHLSVEATKTKSSVGTLSIPEPLVEELARHLATYRPGAGPGDLVFTGSRGMPLRRSFAARVFKPAVERSGLDPTLTFRGLRKVATSYMVDDGVHPRVIQYRLGHATVRLSQELYAKVSDAADVDAAAPALGHDFRLLRARSGHKTKKANDPGSWTAGKNGL